MAPVRPRSEVELAAWPQLFELSMVLWAESTTQVVAELVWLVVQEVASADSHVIPRVLWAERPLPLRSHHYTCSCGR